MTLPSPYEVAKPKTTSKATRIVLWILPSDVAPTKSWLVVRSIILILSMGSSHVSSVGLTLLVKIAHRS